MRAIVFGPGYCGRRIIARLGEMGDVTGVGRNGPSDLADRLSTATHVVVTVPPQGGSDPILAAHGALLAGTPARLIYLSSTGVYGDTAGAWTDETAPLAGRRHDRIAADTAWQASGAFVLRLPGIYGPGRSAIDRLLAGTAHRVDVPGHMFSRVHVDDIVAAVVAAMTTAAPPGAYNIADDRPASQSDLIAWTADRLGITPPPLVALEDAALSRAARAFYGENRRIANRKAKRLLGWRPLYPDYRAGLRALIATTSPAITSTPPTIAMGVQR